MAVTQNIYKGSSVVGKRTIYHDSDLMKVSMHSGEAWYELEDDADKGIKRDKDGHIVHIVPHDSIVWCLATALLFCLMTVTIVFLVIHCN